MAIIYSNRNDNTSTHTTVDANTTTTWAGGVVPLPADQVYVVGRRTTINQAEFVKWTGTRTITVASTTNFATTGFFYVVNNGGEIIKVNYTGTTATTFTGCSVDESDSFYSWTSGQTIPNGGYVHNPAYIVEVGVGETFECNEMIIEQGGWFFVNGGTLKVNQGILVRDGRLVGRGNGTITISRSSASLASIGYLTGENYPLSIIDIEGSENRTYATIQSTTSKGDISVTIDAPTNGSFAVGDEVALFELNDYRRRNKGYAGYRDATANMSDMDEGFDIAGVSGSTIYLALRNSAKGVVKSVATVGSQKVLEVLPESIYFNAGDKILIDNVAYTVDAVEDSEFLLYNYDFTNPSTSLSDFWVNDSTHVYSSGWEIESGVGLKNTAGAYRELINKYFWTREAIIEAELSPLSAYGSGTRGSAPFGICAAYDPSFRWGHRGYDTFKSDYLIISDVDQDLTYCLRSMGNYNNNRPDRVASVSTLIQGPVAYKVVNRKAKSVVYMNGQELTTEFRRDGHFKGLVGVYTNGNASFRCRSLKISQATQKLYITTTDTFSVDDVVWTTGMDHSHLSGSRLLKIASINTGQGNHKDLAFAYSGQNGSGEWPLIMQINGASTTNSSLPYLHNHDMNYDYYVDFGNAAAARSITFDLTAQKTFTHVSFDPRLVDVGSNWNKMKGVAIYGSNDLTTWTTLYGPTDDTKNWYRYSFNRLAFYPTGTVSYRYVKFETAGSDVTPFVNRYINIGVHNFSDGYTISLNNVSDFAIGDKISVMADGGWSTASREYEGYLATVSNSADPETFWQSGWYTECTITNKVGNKLYLDKPVFWGYIEDADSVTVVKTNRNFTIQGTIANSGSSNDWRWPNIFMNDGGNLCRRYLFKGVRFQYVGSYRYTGSTTANRGIITASDDYWNMMMLDGCSYPMGNGDNTWGNIGSNFSAGCIIRNSYIANSQTAIFVYYVGSFAGVGIFNNKINGCLYGLYSEGVRSYSINYNEISTADVGIRFGGMRTERGVLPAPNEVRYNYIKGTSNSGFNIYQETVGPRRLQRIKIENNKLRGMDDYSVAGQTFSGNPYVNSNFMSDHMGSRMSRYRNEGHMAEADTSSDLSWTTPQQNYGRFGYDLAHNIYYYAERNYDYPEYTRFYSTQGDTYYSIIGIELDVLQSNIPFEIVVKFDYRIPLMANLQDDGTDDGRLRLYALQRGEIKGSLQYGVIPASAGTGWNTFTGTFNSFSQLEGYAGVFLNRSAQNGYVDIRNSYATVRTDYPDKIKVVGNTFNLERVWEQYGENRDKALLTAPTRTININRIKF